MGKSRIAARRKKKRAELRQHGLPIIWKDGKVCEVPA